MKETKQSQLQSLKASSLVFALLQGSFSHLSDYDPLPVGHCRGSSFRGVDGNHRAVRFMTLLLHLVCEGEECSNTSAQYDGNHNRGEQQKSTRVKIK